MAKLYFKIASDWEEVVRLRNEIAKLKQELKGMDSTQSPVAFKALNTQLSASTQRMDELVNKAAQAGAVMEGDFKKKIFDASQTVNALSEKITLQRGTIQQLKNELSGLKDKYREALKQGVDTSSLEAKMKSTSAKLREQKDTLFNLTQEQANARLSVKKLRDEYELYNNDGKNVVATNEAMAISWKKALGVIGGVAALKRLGSEIIRVRGEFQSMQTAIETMVGKDMAGQLIPQIKELAKISPLTMSDMVGAEKMMLGFNIQAEDTIKYLKAISDISMGESGKFNSLTLAFSQMSAAGKLMGQDLNQMINAGFNPLQVIAEKTGKSIAALKEEMSKGAVSAEMVQQAFIDATSAGGKFYGMSENASKTINGQISMMQDALDAAFNEIGTKSEGVIMSGIKATTSLIQNYETVGKVLAGLIEIYGTYRVALIANAIIEQGFNKAIWAKVTATKAATIAQATYNKILSLNPYVTIGMAVVSLGIAMWTLADSTTAAEKAQKRFNDEQAKFNKQQEERKQKIEELIRIIQDETETEYAKVEAYEELQRYSPALVAAYSREELATLELAKSQKVLNEERDKNNYDHIISEIDKYTKRIASLRKIIGNSGQSAMSISNQIEDSKKQLEIWNSNLDEYNRLKKQAEEDAKPVKVKLLEAEDNRDKIQAAFDKAKKKLGEEQEKLKNNPFYVIPFHVQLEFDTLQDKLAKAKDVVAKLLGGDSKVETKNKSYWENQKKEAETALESIASSQKKLMDAGKFDGIDGKIVESYKKNTKLLEEAERELKVYDSSSKQENQAEKLRQEQEKYKLLLDKQKLDRIRAEEDLQMQVDEARIKAMGEGSAKTIAEMELNYKKELQAIDRQKEDALRKKIGDARAAWEANPQNKGKSFDAFYKEAQNVKGIGNEMATLFGGGNVDLLARPVIDAAKLVEKGWKDAGDGIATVFSSSYQVDQGGKEVMIQVTPILPDGTVLSQSELEEYIDSRLNGAKDVLEADNKGIVIHVDTDVSPEKSEEFGRKLHEYQEKFYDGLSKLKKRDANFDFSWLGLDGKENELFNSLYESATVNYKNAYAGVVNQYQSYVDERLAIEKKYNDDIAVLQEARRQAESRGDKEEVAKIDRAKAQATKDKGEQLMRKDYEQLKKSPEYVRAFENLKQTSSETLTSLLSQLEAAKQTAAEVLNPEDLREYTSTIQSIVDELTERNPFQTIINKKKELARAEQELAKAKKLLETTDKKGYVILADYDEKTGETVYTYLTATEALKKYNEAKDHVIKTDGELQAAEKKVGGQVEELGNALKNIGGIIGGTSGEIISLMGDIYSFTSLSMEGISKLSGEAAKEMSALEKASVILGIIAAAIQLLQQLDSLTGDAHSQYERYAEKIAEINRLTDAVNEYRLAALEAQQAEKNWFSKDNLGNLRDYRELHEEIANAYDEKANEKQAVYENEGGGGWLTSLWKPFTTLIDKTYGKVFGFNINKEYEEGTAKATDNLRIETRKKSKGFLGTGIGGKSQKTEDLVAWARKNGFGELFDEDGLINKEAGKAILEKYGDKLVGQTKETLEELLELREKYDEYIDQLHEYVNSMYEPLVDNFVDAIFDWLDTGKDALDSFRDYASDTFRNIARDMVKSLVISQIFGTGEDSFQNKINALYEQYSKGELTEEELNRKVAEETALLGKKAEEKLPVIQKSTGIIADVLEQVAGIDLRDKGGSTSQSSTSGGFQTMSQDSADELNGRFTALQMTGEEIRNQSVKQTGLLESIDEKMSLLDLTNENLPSLTAPGVPDIAGQNKETIMDSYQPPVNIVFPEAKLDVLTAEVSNLKAIVDEMRTFQANASLDRQVIAEHTAVLAKNSPQLLANADEIKRNSQKW